MSPSSGSAITLVLPFAMFAIYRLAGLVHAARRIFLTVEEITFEHHTGVSLERPSSAATRRP